MNIVIGAVLSIAIYLGMLVVYVERRYKAVDDPWAPICEFIVISLGFLLMFHTIDIFDLLFLLR